MGKGTKTNPRKKVLTAADTKKAKRELEAIREDILHKAKELDDQKAELVSKVAREAVYASWAVIFRCLKDKRGWATDSLKRLKNYAEQMSEAVSKGEITMQEVYQSLKDEDDIEFEGIEYGR